MKEDSHNKETSELWAALAETIEKKERTGLEHLPVPEASRSFADRLAALYLNGFLPALVVAILAVLASGVEGEVLLLLGGLLMSPLVGLLMAPLIRGQFGASVWRLLLVAGGVLILTPFLRLLPAAAVRLLKREPWEALPVLLDFPSALALQSHFEQIFQVSHFCAYGLSVAALMVSVAFVRKRFPWIELPKQRPWSALPGLGLVLAPWLCLAWLWVPNPDHEQWKEAVAPQYRETLVSQLPQRDGSTVWADLYEDFTEQRNAPHDPNPSPEFVKACQNFEEKVLKQIGRELPTSHQELSTAYKVFRELSWRGHVMKHPLSLATVEMSSHFRGMKQGYSVANWRKFVIPWLSSPERTEDQLLEAERQISTILETDLPSVQELDLRVYDIVYGHGQLPTPPQQVQESVRIGQRWADIRRFSPRPMKVGPWTLESSPTRLLRDYQKRQFLKAWLEVRPTVADGFTSKEQWGLTIKDWAQPFTRESFYSDEVFRYAHCDELKSFFETTHLYLKIRLYKIRQGRLPKLSEIGVKESARWTLTKVEGEVRLVDPLGQAPFAPIEPWRFP